jgi:hypothetical protein
MSMYNIWIYGLLLGEGGDTGNGTQDLWICLNRDLRDLFWRCICIDSGALFWKFVLDYPSWAEMEGWETDRKYRGYIAPWCFPLGKGNTPTSSIFYSLIENKNL